MNYESKELKTKRLVIKKGAIDDYLKVYEYDFNLLKGIEGIVKLEKQDPEKIKAWFKGGIKRYYSKIEKAHMFDWILYNVNKPIGNILTKDEDIEKKQIEVSFNLHPSYWGNNLIPEAMVSVIEYLFSIGYDNIICSYKDGNLKAKRVLEKLGFKANNIIKDAWKNITGNLIDEYQMIMTKEDWFSRTTKISVIKSSL